MTTLVKQGLFTTYALYFFFYLQRMHSNNVPSVIASLEEWVQAKRTQTYIPPAFYDRDGTFIQPPSFEMPAYVIKKPANWSSTNAGNLRSQRIAER